MGNFLVKAKYQCRKHSPEILIGTGIVTFVGTVVAACIATKKVKLIVEDHNERLSDVEEGDGKAKVAVYVQTGCEFAKIYAPAAVLGVASVSCFLGSHHIMSERNAALTTAYAALNTAYSQYRARVVEKYGEDVDFELATGSTKEKIEVTETDENGKEKKSKKSVDVVNPNNLPPYTWIFKEGNPYWQGNDEYHTLIINGVEKVANAKLVANRFVPINDILPQLGFEKRKDLMDIGWNYRGDGDGYIEIKRRKIFLKNVDTGELEPALLLEFNVDGPIMAPDFSPREDEVHYDFTIEERR